MKRKWQKLIRLVSLIIVLGLASWVAWPTNQRWSLKLGLDLSGGSHLVYRADTSQVPVDDADSALAGVRDVIERRVNAFGIGEPVVQTNEVDNEKRIIVELPGILDPNEAIERIGQTPQLDFRKEVNVSADDLEEELNVDDSTELSGPVFERTELSGRNLKRASLVFDPLSGAPTVQIDFDSQGQELFTSLTEENIGRRIAIYLDGVPISAPVVQARITNGQAVISGGFSLEEARALASRLNAGALPIPIELLSQQTIGPSLGQKSIEESIRAGVAGLIGIAVWMLVFYRLPGLASSVALSIYLILMIAIIKLVPVTLTLAGVAGVVLSVGMAVDANVLIFERLRENLRRGKPWEVALQSGFKEAWEAIRAANMSSLLTAVILYFMGTSIIRGFALTFGIGVILSMLTAIVITKTILQFMWLDKLPAKKFFIGV